MKVINYTFFLLLLFYGCDNKNLSDNAPDDGQDCIEKEGRLSLFYNKGYLTICGEYSTRIHYIEAYVRSGSSNQE